MPPITSRVAQSFVFRFEAQGGKGSPEVLLEVDCAHGYLLITGECFLYAGVVSRVGTASDQATNSCLSGGKVRAPQRGQT